MAKPLFAHQLCNFLLDTNTREERWEGQRISPDVAKAFYGVDEAHYVSKFRKYCDKYFEAVFKSGMASFALWYDFDSPTNKQVHSDLVNLRDYLVENFKSSHIIQSPR